MTKRNDAALAYFSARKSVPLPMMTRPGPDESELNEILTLAARSPDHGKLVPWRFVIYRDEHGEKIGEQLEALAREIHPDKTEAEYEKERIRLRRAPVAIGVVHVPRDVAKIPDWEQFLSAGAVAMNLVHAATAMGFGANWVTGWYSDNAQSRAILGLAPDERVAGIVHIGSYDAEIAERDRPDVETLVSEWSGPYQGDE